MPETDQEFCDRFSRLFGNHIAVLVKKDFPVLIAHMSECGICEECHVSEGCSSFVDGFLKLENELPACIAGRLARKENEIWKQRALDLLKILAVDKQVPLQKCADAMGVSLKAVESLL